MLHLSTMDIGNISIFLALCHLCIAPKSNHSPIRPPEEAIHKCRLLDTEIPAITYNSGGTYTLGALQQALDVLQVRQSIRFCFSSSEIKIYLRRKT